MDESEGLTADDVEKTKREKILETPDERRTRLLSLRIIYFTMFLMTLGFSIILTGIWPYLDKVNPESVPHLLISMLRDVEHFSFRFS